MGENYIIVGLDWGINVGVAIFGIDGKLITSKTFKNPREDDVIKFLNEFGKPILITTDVKDPPEQVRKIASKLGAKLFTPKKDLTVKEKSLFTRRVKLKTVHEKDAAASVYYFLKLNKPLFTKIERVVKKELMNRLIAEVKKMILLGEASNIEEAIRKLFQKEKEIKEIVVYKKSGREKELEQKIKALNEIIKKQTKLIKTLQEKLEKKEVIREKVYLYKDPELKERIEKYEYLINKLKDEIRTLEGEIEKYRKFLSSEVVLEKLSDIEELWAYIPKRSKITIKMVDIVNRKIIKALKEIDPREVLYESAANDSLIDELRDEGILIIKKDLSLEDVFKIFSKKRKDREPLVRKSLE